jgi:hypothetical protein
VFFQVLDADFPGEIGPVPIAASFQNLRRSMVDEFMNPVKAAGEVQAAMPIGNQDSRLDGIDFRGHNADRNRGIRFVSAEYFVRDKGFLFDDPERPVKGGRSFFVLHENQSFFMTVIHLLRNFEQPPVLSSRADIMKGALIHFACHRSADEIDWEMTSG